VRNIHLSTKCDN